MSGGLTKNDTSGMNGNKAREYRGLQVTERRGGKRKMKWAVDTTLRKHTKDLRGDREKLTTSFLKSIIYS